MNATTSPLRSFAPLIIAVLTAAVFDQLFFDRSTGINVFLFVALLMALLVWRQGWSNLSLPARVAMLGALLTATMTVVHNSIMAPLVTVPIVLWASALALEPGLRSLPYGAAQSFANYLVLPLAAVEGMGRLVPERSAARSGWRWTRIAVIPVIVLVVFFQLYRAGNPKFEHLTAGFLDGFWDAIARAFEAVFTAHTLFFLFGLVLCAGLLFRFAPKLVLQLEQQWSDTMVRVRHKRPHWMAPRAMDPLERERRKGLLLLALANALLLVVNIIDIDWVWFGFEVPVDFSLKQFVHEGTWMLMISILLSMGVVLYLFRGNQNFYARNVWLKRLAKLWVLQNMVLGISVFLRNYHYISFHGLAYKRIGVIVFLLLVLVGLVTLFAKVHARKSFFHLLRVNTWAAFAVLVGLTTVDWDSFIVRTNLAHSNSGEIDIDNYLEMGDKVLPLLYANIDLVEKQMQQHRKNRVRWVDHLEPLAFRTALDAKRDRFLLRMADQPWQEWNLADRRTLQALAQPAQLSQR